MLVLSRKEGESIVIQGPIIITVLKIQAHRVRIGIDAPEHMDVYRGEIFEAITKEKTRKQLGAENANDEKPSS